MVLNFLLVVEMVNQRVLGWSWEHWRVDPMVANYRLATRMAERMA